MSIVLCVYFQKKGVGLNLGGLGPKVGSAGSVLRPLAHLGIREQTVATALMLCLADCIETAQGNPAETPEQAVVKGVYSYGNRLYQAAEKPHAFAHRHSWHLNFSAHSFTLRNFQSP